MLPHVVWLVRMDFPTFGYASHSMAAHLPLAARPLDVAGFLGNQMGRCVPALLMGLLLLAMDRRSRGELDSLADAAAPRNRDLAMPARLLLPVHAIGPFVLMTGLSLFVGVDLQMHWGTAFLWLLVPFALTSPAGRRLTQLPIGRLYAGVLLVHLLTLAAHAR